MTIPSFLTETTDFLLVTINVHPSSTQKKIVIIENSFDIYVKEPPDKGKANKAIIKFISKQFNIPSSCLSIVRGHKSKTKIISITEEQMVNFKRKILEMIV